MLTQSYDRGDHSACEIITKSIDGNSLNSFAGGLSRLGPMNSNGDARSVR